MIPVSSTHYPRRNVCRQRQDQDEEDEDEEEGQDLGLRSAVLLSSDASASRTVESSRVPLFACLLILTALLILVVGASGQDPITAHRINSLQQLKCDRVFVSSRNPDSKNGSFTAPSLQNNANHSRQCIYTFEALVNERVEVTFTSFNLRGAHPEYVSHQKKST